MAEYGFPEKHATDAAAAAARKLADGNVSARWRVSADGTIELVRATGGFVELHRVGADGTSMLVERSPRSWRRTVCNAWFTVGFVFLFVAFIGFAIADSTGSDRFVTALGIAWGAVFASLFVVGAATPSDDSLVEKWMRRRFVTDDRWPRVPRDGDLGPATGNQQVTVAGLVDASGRTALARRRDDGIVEVATTEKDSLVVRHLDPLGEVTFTERVAKPRQGAAPWLAGAGAVAALAFAIAAEGPPAWVAWALVPALVLLAMSKITSAEDMLGGEWTTVRTDEPGD